MIFLARSGEVNVPSVGGDGETLTWEAGEVGESALESNRDIFFYRGDADSFARAPSVFVKPLSCIPLTVCTDGFGLPFLIVSTKKTCHLTFDLQGPPRLVAKRLKNDWLSIQNEALNSHHYKLVAMFSLVSSRKKRINKFSQ